jgi:hypothetical protein
MRKKTRADAKAVLAELQTFAYYNPETGHFICTRFQGGKGKKVGEILGTMRDGGYLVLRVGGTLFRNARLAWLWMTGEWPRFEIDHINRITWDDRWENLRDVTPTINSRNRPRQSNNTSGITGVYWAQKDQKWRAQIKMQGKCIVIGDFDSKEEATKARYEYTKTRPELGFHPNHGKRRSDV